MARSNGGVNLQLTAAARLPHAHTYLIEVRL
jgi:hypothetical protein